MASLFDAITVGDLALSNRVFMAPLTRSRAGDERTANALMARYYAQRAGAGLIVSEATSVTPMGVGYAGTPGVWSDEQVEGWQGVTHAVHAAGGRIFMQLWHVGRISHPMFLNGATPVAPSAIAASGTVSLVRPKQPYPTPRALAHDEIPAVIEAYRWGAENAQRAGFDGVQLHAANGYLLDQFLQTSANHRTDEYGGSIENRARLLLEVTDAVISVWGAGRVSVHLAPRGDAHSMGDPDRLALFSHVAHALGARQLAFLSAREYFAADSIGPALKQAFGGPYVINEKLTFESASAALAEGFADAASFGRAFLANPDLMARFRAGAPLNEPDKDTFYVGGASGYSDYPGYLPLATEQSAGI